MRHSRPSTFHRPALGVAFSLVGLVLLAGCARFTAGPADADVQRAMTWCLRKTYAKQFALPGGDNYFAAPRRAAAPALPGGTEPGPPFVATITRRATKTDAGERWYVYEFTAIGRLESGDVTFRGTVGLVKRGNTWFFRREPSAGG